MKSGSKTWIVTVCLIGIATWITISPVKLPLATYYGFFRYSDERWFGFEDRTNYLPIERNIFSQFYRFPYLYLYGPTGYTKINFLVFRGSIEKIPNKGFYDDPPSYRGDGDRGTLEELRKKYGSGLLVRKSWDDVKREDRLIYAKLQEEGRNHLGWWRRTGNKDFSEWAKKRKKIGRGLDMLNAELKESLQ